MTSNDVLNYMIAAGRPLYFWQITNYFPGDGEEPEVLKKVQYLVRMGKVRRLPTRQYEVVCESG